MKKCLIIVDYQNDFVSGALGFHEAAVIAPRLAEKIRTYKEQGDDVIFTFDTHGKIIPIRRRGGICPYRTVSKGRRAMRLRAKSQPFARRRTVASAKTPLDPTHCTNI